MEPQPSNDPFEILLGELRFTHPDQLPGLIETRLPDLTDEFYAFVDAKRRRSDDLEERQDLSMLVDAVKQIAEEIEGVLSKGDSRVVDVSKGDGYEALIESLVAEGKDVAAETKAAYDQVDSDFLRRLEDMIAPAAEEKKQRLQIVKDTVGSEMNVRMTVASERLKELFATGSADAAFAKLAEFSQKGFVDEPLILLLEANIQQAEQAAAIAATNFLLSLKKRAMELKEQALDPERQLIRKLLRTEDFSIRQQILTEALTPEESIMLADGTNAPTKRVDGKKFVESLRGLIEDFGNIDPSFIKKLSKIGEESEEVARQIFGLQDKDVKTLQDEAFHKRTISVWDLEKAEIQAESQGQEAPWEGKAQGFDQDGRKLI